MFAVVVASRRHCTLRHPESTIHRGMGLANLLSAAALVSYSRTLTSR